MRCPLADVGRLVHALGRGPEGPRSVHDVALMLGAISGPDPRSPVAVAEPGDVFLKPLQRDFLGVRVAWAGTSGVLPVDPRVTAVIAGALPV